MATEKLYEIDAYQTDFTARILSCEPVKNGYCVILDRTAFYPEGGGQPADCGFLGPVQVTDVHERDGEILHTCLDRLPVGEEVPGRIDWARRFDHMQQHSGEHILSGLIHSRYGCDNVGFHMGAEVVTVDFNHLIPKEDLASLELAANEVIWANAETEITLPAPQELAQLAYRSKKALTGQVRIVRFPGADVCACCGTHVRRAGEIGLIKILSRVHFHDGVRLEIVSGRRALTMLDAIQQQNHRVSMRLSAKTLETAAAADRLADENEALKYRLTGLENADFQRVAEDLSGRGNVLVFRDDLNADGARRLADAVQQTCGGCAAVFAGTDEGGYKYALACPREEILDLTRALNEALHGRGGGGPNFTQGSVQATREQIQAFFVL